MLQIPTPRDTVYAAVALNQAPPAGDPTLAIGDRIAQSAKDTIELRLLEVERLAPTSSVDGAWLTNFGHCCSEKKRTVGAGLCVGETQKTKTEGA